MVTKINVKTVWMTECISYTDGDHLYSVPFKWERLPRQNRLRMTLNAVTYLRSDLKIYIIVALSYEDGGKAY